MIFGRWQRLEVAPERIPAEPGVLQLRLAEGLIEYPRGKSAMIYYTVSQDMKQTARELAERYPGRPWLCRYSEEMTASERADLGTAFQRLLASFRVRFGAEPSFPA